jgi:hypothetical protein
MKTRIKSELLLSVLLMACTGKPAPSINEPQSKSAPEESEQSASQAESQCQSMEIAYGATMQALTGESEGVAMERHWTDGVVTHLNVLGPRVPHSRCSYGDDASEFSCTDGHGPLTINIRLQAKEHFTCPDLPQHSTHMTGRMPALETRCHYLFVYYPQEIRYRTGREQMRWVLAHLRTALGATTAVKSCPGWQ